MKITYVGNTKQPRYEIEEGDKFGKLTVRCLSGVDDNYRKFYLCDCECGNEVIVSQQGLLKDNATSCGCIKDPPQRIMKMSPKRHDSVCTYCGKPQHYAKGLCQACYARLMRTGSLEYKEKKPKVIHDKRIKNRAYLSETLVWKTEKEKMLIEGLAENLTYREIGDKLGVTKQRIDQMIRTMCKRQIVNKRFEEVEVEDNEE